MKDNKVFEEIRSKATEWDAIRTEHKKQEEAIIEAHGYCSDELQVWKKANILPPFPITDGAMKAFRAWQANSENETSEFEFSDFTWERETHDFIETLRKAGIKTMVLTCSSTALIENLHAYAAEGCTIEGVATVTRNYRWGETKTLQGIRLRIN